MATKQDKIEKRNEKIKQKALEKKRIRIHDRMNAYEKKHKRERKIAPKDSFISLQHINKIYDNHVQAVFDFNLEIKKHEFIVFVGPSGCGKSTTLRMIAGLEDITSGDLYIDKTYANDLEPKNRDIAMVFQSYALYPHMSVFGNMAFGLKIRKVPRIVYDKNGNEEKEIAKGLIWDTKRERNKLSKFLVEAQKENNEEQVKLLSEAIKELDEKIEYLGTHEVTKIRKQHLPKEEIEKRVTDASEILQIKEYLTRKPKALSGGQCQRVALGRAIVRNAKVFLMDEPLSNLDAKLRVSMRSEIIKLHNRLNATTIYVTHDQTEAMTMATRIVVMNKGYIQQIGTPIEIYNHPANIFVATFIGSPAMNLFEVELEGDNIIFENGLKIKLPHEFILASEKFYKESPIKLQEELDDYEKNFAERNDLEAKIAHLKELMDKQKSNLVKNLLTKEIEKLSHELEVVENSDEKRNFLISAIKKYKDSEENARRKVVFGIRPEDIYQEGHVDTEGVLSEKFDLDISVAELLGNEYFLHCNFADKEIVAKVTAKKLINVDEKVSIYLDLSKAHLFDKITSNLIK